MFKMTRLFLLCCLGLFGVAFADDSISASMQPFQVKVEPQNHSYIWVKFNIDNGYHLYQSKIKIVSTDKSSVKLGAAVMPDPITLPNVDPDKTNVYENKFAIQVPINDYANGQLDIQVNYQGCKGASLCLPEQVLNQSINLTTGLVIGSDKAKPTTPLISQDVKPDDLLSVSASSEQIAKFFGNSVFLVIAGFFALGLLIAFTPCVFPLLPILITVIAGKNISHKRSFVLAFSYILGGAVLYAAAGVVAASVGQSISVWFQTWWVSAILAVLFIIFALSLFGLFEIQLPAVIQQRLNNSVNKTSGGSIVGAFIIGGLSNLILSPCVTAPLAGALIYISTTGNQILGGVALFALGLGSGVPLLIIAVFGKKLLPKSGSWMLITKQVLGLIMLAMAGYMISKIFIGFDDVIVIIWSAISIIKLGRNIKVLNNPKIAKIAVSFVLIVAVGVYKYTSDIKMRAVDEKFISVTTVAEFDQQLALAKERHQPVILDFYANWCSACKELDLRTFSNQQVQDKFKQYAMIRVDVTRNSSDIQALQNRYGIFALPTILMISPDGTEVSNLHTYGFIPSNEFLAKLEQFDQSNAALQCGVNQTIKC